MAKTDPVIPLYDFRDRNLDLRPQLHAALDRVLDSGRYVLGPELTAFEQALAGRLGVAYALGVNSGTDAIVLALDALGIGPGDEVITTPFTFHATAEAIVRTGARPVFADIEPETLCMSPDACSAAINDRTRAVLLVHVFGHCARIDRFTELCGRHKLHLVEDAAQAIGSSWQGRPLGSFGRVSTFSFYPTKNLGALGDAGAVATSDKRLADSIAQIRSHGRNGTGQHTRLGYNSRLDDLQAAFLLLKLEQLDAENQRRQHLASVYDRELPGQVRPARGADGCMSNYHQYGILTEPRDELREYLAEHGIETGLYYQHPAYREPALQHQGLDLPAAETACRQVLTLPIRPSLTDAQQSDVIRAVNRFFAS